MTRFEVSLQASTLTELSFSAVDLQDRLAATQVRIPSGLPHSKPDADWGGSGGTLSSMRMGENFGEEMGPAVRFAQ